MDYIFVRDWKSALKYGYSVWLTVASILLLWVPELIYALTGRDYNPFTMMVLATLLLLATILGRLLRQEYRGRWARRVTLAILTIALLVGANSAWAMSALPVDTEPEISADLDEWDLVGPVAVPMIAKWEGKRNRAYFDVVGVATICYGHTRTVTAQDVHADTTWSDQRCTQLLSDEAEEYWAGWRSAVTLPEPPVPTQAAFGSLAFNVGIGAARRSTATRRLNAGNIPGACEAIGWYNKAGGRVIRGLVNRRSYEVDVCLRGAA